MLSLGLGVPATPPGFEGGSISGCVLDLRADVGVTLVSGKVSAWADQSGSGAVFSQATAGQRPTFNATDSAYGNQPTLSFAFASSQVLIAGSSLLISQPCTVLVVGQNSESLGGYLDCNDTSPTRFGLYGGPDLGLYAGTAIAGTATDSSPCVLCGVFNGASSNGYKNNSATANPSSINPGSNGIGLARIGGGVITNFLNGKIARVLIYNRALSAAERGRLFLDCAARYGISAS